MPDIRPSAAVPPEPAYRSASWARAATDAAAFAREQAALGHVWTCLGLAADVAEDGRWFRTWLGGRSVFVQRFGKELRGFENRCAHRFYPLRTADRGRGPVICGFHHWRYDKDGLALGIPVCEEAYGVTPRALGQRLRPMEVEALGGLVFGRFPSPEHRESLADFLGDAAPILEMSCPPGAGGRHLTQEIPAYWKFLTHIALEEYHLVAVHPSTFGKKGYLKGADITYARLGRHSAYVLRAAKGGIATIVAGCRNRSYRPHSYFIVNLFPALSVSHFHVMHAFGRAWFFQLVCRYVPLAPGRSRLDAWVMPAPMDPPRPGFWEWPDRLTLAVLGRIVPFYARRVLNEDNGICIGLQNAAGGIDAEQRLSPVYEPRIGWFEEEYAREVGGRPGAGRSAVDKAPVEAVAE